MPGDPFYRSAAWLDARAGYLTRHPRCEVLSCGEPATHVDHKVPRRRGGAALDPRNFQALCHSHHSEKTARKDGGFGRRPGEVTFKGCEASGRPIDPGHPWRRARAAT
ncbi:HNH endonuclease [Roseococcus sp. YIM B11640]|uniref:HNH endonuclease n=1 Tax=Roseococcus sp. YIM B11640 TaxID=3133973 RepID=UPI003C7B4946